MPKAETLSPTQSEIVSAMRANGGELVRMPGGYWTYPGCPTKPGAGGDLVPQRYWTVQSVGALMRMGFLREVERSPRGFLVRAGLTQKGAA